jgi:hypothetical protein
MMQCLCDFDETGRCHSVVARPETIPMIITCKIKPSISQRSTMWRSYTMHLRSEIQHTPSGGGAGKDAL